MRDAGEGFHFNIGSHALYLGGAAQEVLDGFGIELRAGSPKLSGSLARYSDWHSRPWGLRAAMPLAGVPVFAGGLLVMGSRR